FFKQKTAYEITRRDWSSDVCSSDLVTVSRPTDAAIALGDIIVGTIRPGRAGIGEQITITVPVANVGTGNLHDVTATVTAVSGTPSTVSPAIASFPASGGMTLA